MQGAEDIGFKNFNLKYRRSIMKGTYPSENMRVEMPNTNVSGDPETSKKIPVVTEAPQTKKPAKKSPPAKQ